MSATEKTTMEKKPSMNPFPKAFTRLSRVVGAALMFALVLTLFVIPAMYLYLSKEKKVLPETVPQEAAVPETVES